MSFDHAYRQPDAPPWDIGEPQPEIVRLADEGRIEGSVIDIGCGTGENALFLAARGYHTLGVDSAPTAIARARAKADERGIDATFIEADVLEPGGLGGQFDTAIDVGCFHVFDDVNRSRYVGSVTDVIRPGGHLHLLCFSDAQPGILGPRRVSERELRDSFADGWWIEELKATVFATRPDAPFPPSGPLAWLASMRRT